MGRSVIRLRNEEERSGQIDSFKTRNEGTRRSRSFDGGIHSCKLKVVHGRRVSWPAGVRHRDSLTLSGYHGTMGRI